MGLQVLIVDDSATMRSILRKVVSLSGYEVSNFVEAGNGVEACRVLSENWVDVILLDIHMPVMDGITFLKHIQKDELLTRIPVILVTTEGRMETLDEAKRLGVRAHIKKPFRPEQIRDVLDDILGDEYARSDKEVSDGCDF